jgi:hypothetical protein
MGQATSSDMTEEERKWAKKRYIEKDGKIWRKKDQKEVTRR